jgi:hypothetical protein
VLGKLFPLSATSPRWFLRLLLVLSLLSVVPLWLVERPPFQDWPQHLATIRVLLDYSEPALRLSDAVQIDLSRTQYLGFYLAAAALAKLLGVAVATKLLLSPSLLATPLALRALLRALGRDERHALFVLPLTYNAHVILGFLNFVAAIPLALLTLTVAAHNQAERTIARAVSLGALLVLLFCMHVVLFALAGSVSSLS